MLSTKTPLLRKSAEAVLCVCLLSGCSSGTPTSQLTPVVYDNSVVLNSTAADLSGYTLIEGETADFQEITMQESVRLFAEGGTGVLYFGKVSCPYCQRAAAELNKVAFQTEVTVWYVDTSEVPLEAYNALVPYIEETFTEDEDGSKTFYAPEVIGVKNGEIAGYHVSLVSSFHLKDDNLLSEKQQKELQGYYRDIILALADSQ